MAGTESSSSEKSMPESRANLGLASLLGGVLLLGALWLVFGGFPYFWTESLEAFSHNPFLSAALLLICSGLLIVALWFVGYQQLEKVDQPGLRAGSFIAAWFIYLSLWLTVTLGGWLGPHHDEIREGMTIIFGLALLAGVVWIFRRPGFRAWLISHESSGWYHANSYKGNQGVRVRRGTIVGILTLGLCGIYSMVSHGQLGTDIVKRSGAETVTISNDWYWKVPFTDPQTESDDKKDKEKSSPTTSPDEATGYLYIPLMYKVHMVLPILLGIALIWFAWRLVNQPTFADFLIATEAEMNKVSWTTRKRLYQDTIVVLVTVVLMTIYLFVIDLAWIWALTKTGVLHSDPRAEQQKSKSKSPW